MKISLKKIYRYIFRVIEGLIFIKFIDNWTKSFHEKRKEHPFLRNQKEILKTKSHLWSQWWRTRNVSQNELASILFNSTRFFISSRIIKTRSRNWKKKNVSAFSAGSVIRLESIRCTIGR